MIQRMIVLSLMFSLSSCLLFWQKATEEEESGAVGPEILALLEGSCSLSETLEIFDGQFLFDQEKMQEFLDLMTNGRVEQATAYNVYGLSSGGNWVLLGFMDAATYGSDPGQQTGTVWLQGNFSDYNEFMIRAASPECLGPPSNVYQIEAQTGP